MYILSASCFLKILWWTVKGMISMLNGTIKKEKILYDSFKNPSFRKGWHLSIAAPLVQLFNLCLLFWFHVTIYSGTSEILPFALLRCYYTNMFLMFLVFSCGSRENHLNSTSVRTISSCRSGTAKRMLGTTIPATV